MKRSDRIVPVVILCLCGLVLLGTLAAADRHAAPAVHSNVSTSAQVKQ